MTNLRTLPKVVIESALQTVEQKLVQMKTLKDEIKELQAYYDLLQKDVISEHFNDSSEYVTARGLTLATYKGADRTSFQQKEFEATHPDLFKKFSKKKMVFTFRLN